MRDKQTNTAEHSAAPNLRHLLLEFLSLAFESARRLVGAHAELFKGDLLVGELLAQVFHTSFLLGDLLTNLQQK